MSTIKFANNAAPSNNLVYSSVVFLGRICLDDKANSFLTALDDIQGTIHVQVGGTTGMKVNSGGIETDMVKTGIVEIDRGDDYVDNGFPNGLIGDLSTIGSAFTPGIGIDNQYFVDVDGSVSNDIRLWFPLNRDEDAVIFNTNPELYTAAMNFKKDLPKATINDIYLRFSHGEFYFPSNTITPDGNSGGIMSSYGKMNFYYETGVELEDVDNNVVTEDWQTMTSPYVRGIEYITAMTVYEYDHTKQGGVTSFGLLWDEVTQYENGLTALTDPHAPVASTMLSYDETDKITITTRYICQDNLIPIMWSAIQWLNDNKVGL